VVNDAPLISAVDRQIRTISFAPIEAKATAGTLGTTRETNDLMRHDPTGINGHFTTFHRAVRPALSPGSGLNEMVHKAVRSMDRTFTGLHQANGASVNFFTWVRHHVLQATTVGEYGPGNPFQDPDFEKDWL
jgi:hypothetical protein